MVGFEFTTYGGIEIRILYIIIIELTLYLSHRPVAF